MDEGILKQLAYFRRDYRDGEAIARRYLTLLNSQDYLSKVTRLVVPNSAIELDTLFPCRKRVSKDLELKALKALEVFPQGHGMSARELFYVVRQDGYKWKSELKDWRKTR
jgi:cyclopropane fatty-acyl-phospholipid synthase-like methyltransferase